MNENAFENVVCEMAAILVRGDMFLIKFCDQVNTYRSIS